MKIVEYEKEILAILKENNGISNQEIKDQLKKNKTPINSHRIMRAILNLHYPPRSEIEIKPSDNGWVHYLNE